MLKTPILLAVLVVIIIAFGFFTFERNLIGQFALVSSDSRLPFPPYNQVVSITNYNQVNFSWSDDSANSVSLIPVTEFRVLRKQPTTSIWTVLGKVTTRTYVDTNLSPGSYDYKAEACNTNGCSENQSYVTTSFYLDTIIPTKPGNFSVPLSEVTDTKANLYWTASTDDLGIKYYNIYRSIATSNNFKVVASTSATSYKDSGLSPVTNYYYQVKAVDLAKNESIATDAKSIITLTLTNNGNYIRVVSPNGGECFTLPGNLRITWTGVGVNQAALYYGDKRLTFGRDTIFDWYMTASVSPTTSGAVKAVGFNDKGEEIASDTSDIPFSISANCSKVSSELFPVPAIPTFFKASLVTEKKDVNLSWQDNSKNETEFNVFRRKLPDGKWQFLVKFGPNVVSYTDKEVSPADYEYDVNACNVSGCSEYSNTYKITVVTTLATPTPQPGKIYSEVEIYQGDMISANGSSDPDIYIINDYGYKRLFLNPAIFSFYGHLGGFERVKNIEPTTRNKYITSGLFRNCETNDEKIYGIEITGEDTGTLHWLNVTGEQAVASDPDFFKKVFCINNNEFGWYKKGSDYSSLSQVPIYER